MEQLAGKSYFLVILELSDMFTRDAKLRIYHYIYNSLSKKIKFENDFSKSRLGPVTLQIHKFKAFQTENSSFMTSISVNGSKIQWNQSLSWFSINYQTYCII